jgi:hypothetical protein
MFSPREVAADRYAAVAGMGYGRVLGVDADQVTAARVGACVSAEQAIARAIGTERVLLREPDDAMLRRWLLQVQHRRDELQTTT